MLRTRDGNFDQDGPIGLHHCACSRPDGLRRWPGTLEDEAGTGHRACLFMVVGISLSRSVRRSATQLSCVLGKRMERHAVIRRFKFPARKFVTLLLTEGRDTRRAAAAVFLGIFIGIVPIYGF